MSVDPDLTQAEVDRICEGYVQNAAKIRYLRSLGLTVERRPNGTALVNRKHYEEVRSKAAPEAGGAEAGQRSAPKWTVAA